MRSKRLLAILLALCLVLSVFSPAASAVEIGKNTSVHAEVNHKQNVSSNEKTPNRDNDRVVSGEDLQGPLNLRDDPLLQVEVQENNTGIWEATPGQKPGVSLLPENSPACLEELKKAAEVFSKDETVVAFVVMNDKALAEVYGTMSAVNGNQKAELLNKQNAVIRTIESEVLGGEKLTVRYQFTYLTNSFSIETKFENLEKIAKLPGVKSVFIMPAYDPCEVENTAAPNTAASGAMTGVANVWADLGYTGEGMKIAIIDTGLDLDHPSFAALDNELVAANDSYLSVDDVAAVLENLHASSRRPTAAAKTLYRSTKVPFAFNYCDNNLTADHTADMQGDHGTHVAGIAAANATEGTSVVGMAPNAQIIVMKVFGAAGGAYTDDYVAAIEDAMVLGCDVANLSLGSPAGFSSTDTEIDLIFQRIAEQDIVVTISAGNETDSAYGNMWGTDLNRTQNPDKGVVGGPSTWANAFSIASAENSVVMTEYFTLTNGTNIFFMHNIEYLYGYIYWSLNDFAGEEMEYVIVPGLGTPEDVEKANVAGKIAVIMRGELSFAEKIYNAEMAGAAGVIIWNHNDEDDIFTFGMTTAYGEGVYPNIPVGLVTLSDGQKMANAAEKKLTVSETMGERMVEGGQLSSFSSWGASPDLRLLPDITGIGGNVYSCYDGGQYGLMSGTSMSAPQIAGISALVMQYLYDTMPEVEEGVIRELAMALMMSTANPVISADSGVEASPRQQGAGLVSAAEAVKTHAYLTVNGARPKVELGHGSTGVFTFSFEVNNFGTKTQTFVLDSSLLTEAFASDGYNYYMYGIDMELKGSVTFDKESVTVAPGETVTVNATVTLTDYDKYLFQVVYPNGGFVEGYVYLDNADEKGIDLNLPFMGFYGDWTDAPVFDTAFWYDNSFWGYMPANGLPEGDQTHHIFWTGMGGSDWVLGINPYANDILDENGNVEYNPAYNVVSPNGDGFLDGIEDIWLSLLRNAKDMTFTWTVGDEVVYVENYHNNMKTMFISAYGRIVPWLYSWYGMGMYDFTDAQGNPLPNGTEVLLTITAKVDYADGGDHMIQIPITVDTEAPVLGDIFEVAVDESSNKLIITATDNIALAAVALMNPTGTQLYQQVTDFEVTEEGNYVATLDVTGLGTEFLVALCDYAANETYFNVTYTTAKGDNLPIMDTDLLYAYRVMDEAIYSDHMYGWVSMNKPTAADDLLTYVNAQTDDYLEYAAINAAEYAGGKVFAVDAVYNLVVMDPGLWNRTTICNLGVNVLDMAFDDSTDTMYVLSKQDYEVYLYTMDLLTGELTEVHYFGYYYYAPYAITTDDNGTIYAIGYQKSNIYTLDAENDYEMVPVLMTEKTDEDGNTSIVPTEMTDVYGAELNPNYAQSINYVDGKIYWVYYTSSWQGIASELIVVDLENNTYSNHIFAAEAYDQAGNLVEYYSIHYPMEFVSLITLDETDYQIPEAEALTGIMLDTNEMLMSVGEIAQLKANPMPWNYELTNVTWTTSDETVATVIDGQVQAVGEGMAVITASSEGFEASCLVNVVNVSGNFYAYNYASGDGYSGYLINVDLATMDYSLVGEMPLDFLAADFNGHDGCYYGYGEGGQFYKLDLTTGEIVKIGNPIGTVPADMAYNYAEGIMYAISLNYDYGYTALCQVNLSNGQLIEVGRFDYVFFLTLAADLEGNLYGITYDGMLCTLGQYYDDWFEEYVWYAEPILFELGELQYMQSMCYDYANDVIIWTNPETGCVYWIDAKAEIPYVLALGDPTDSGMVEHVGMFTIPAEIPELPQVAVEEVYAEDMIMIVGANKFADVTILPLNATSKNVAWTSANESIVKIEANGTLTAVAKGETDITGVLTDAITGQTYEVAFHVAVMEGADDIYGHILTDLASMGGQVWARLYPVDLGNPDILEPTEYIIYAEEYYNGKLYAYGYDPNIWEGSSWRLFTMDPVTHVIESYIEMPANFPFVYDMTYNYATSTMYAVAGPSDTASDLYIVDLETGNLIPLLETEQFFMSLAAGPDGLLYAMAPSEEIVEEGGDFWDPWAPPAAVITTNATLYTIDPITCELTLVGDTGIKSNMLSSMSYDYDTDCLYWTPLYQGSGYSGGLCVVDPETAQATNLGVVGVAGGQISGLYIISENFPEETAEELLSFIMTPGSANVLVGQTATVGTFCVPSVLNGNVDVTWTTADPAIAIVNNGMITGVSQGRTTVTATVTHNGKTMTATCQVSVLNADASFLAYNVTDSGWAAINRGDLKNVTNLTEGVEETPVAAIVNVDGKVYGYDDNLKFFQLNLNDFTRNYLGEANPVYDEEMGLNGFQIRDMAYDAANGRVLLLGALGYVDEWGWNEMETGSRIYEVDLTTGKITELYTFYDLYFIRALAADLEGNVYAYCCFNDIIYHVDLETGAQTAVVSTQTQSLYGDTENAQSLYYDALTDTLYLLQTGNGTFYRMGAIDHDTGMLTNLGNVGKVVEGEWSYEGDYFTGLTFVDGLRVGETEEPDETDVDFVSVSASMNGTIGLNFYVVLSEEVLADETAYMMLSVGNETVTIPVSEAKVSVKNGVTRHRFTIELAAAEMADVVVAQMYNAEGVLGRSLAYSVQKYADSVIAAVTDEATIELMKSMLNYGAYAQIHFGHNVENLANANLAAEDQILPETVDVAGFAHKVTGSAEGLTVKNFSLLLQSETTLRVYFTVDEGKSVEDYTFTIDGKAVKPVADGDRFFIELAGIGAPELDNAHVFNLGGVKLTCSAMSYINIIQNNAEIYGEAVVNMVKALFEYNQAANTYFGK